MAKIPKKPNIVLSNIPEQNKRGANSLTIEEWNSVINKLKLQGDLTVRHLHQLHQLLVYSGSDIDDPYLDIELAPGGYGLLTDSVVKYRGEWDAVNNKPELLLVDKTKLGWMYTVGPNASLLNESSIPGLSLTYGDIVVYNEQGELTVIGRAGYPPDEETITLNENDALEATNVSIWRLD